MITLVTAGTIALPPRYLNFISLPLVYCCTGDMLTSFSERVKCKILGVKDFMKMIYSSIYCCILFQVKCNYHISCFSFLLKISMFFLKKFYSYYNSGSLLYCLKWIYSDVYTSDLPNSSTDFHAMVANSSLKIV